MASESGFYTAAEVCEMIEDDDGNPEYLFPGSDDDFGMSDSEEEYDALEREQGNKFTHVGSIKIIKSLTLLSYRQAIPIRFPILKQRE